MNPLIRGYKVVVAAILLLVAVGAIWGYVSLQRALCAKYANV